ncbi:MAG: GntR family transcriptional regulator [Streptosporangiaceae bacterium]
MECYQDHVPDGKREPIPPYRRVADALREDIEAKRLLPGEQVPSATKLAATHHVSRNTAARALRLLRDEGYITTEQGWGSFVADTLPRSDS